MKPYYEHAGNDNNTLTLLGITNHSTVYYRYGKQMLVRVRNRYCRESQIRIGSQLCGPSENRGALSPNSRRATESLENEAYPYAGWSYVDRRRRLRSREDVRGQGSLGLGTRNCRKQDAGSPPSERGDSAPHQRQSSRQSPEQSVRVSGCQAPQRGSQDGSRSYAPITGSGARGIQGRRI